MKFDVTAVIKEIGAIETVGAKGFQKRNLILSEESGDYENLVCIEFSGDKLERPDSHQVGQMVKVSGFVNCNEWNGKFFTSLRGSFIQNVGEQPQQPQQFGQAPQSQTYTQPQQAFGDPQQPSEPVYQASDQAPPLAEDDIPF